MTLQSIFQPFKSKYKYFLWTITAIFLIVGITTAFFIWKPILVSSTINRIHLRMIGFKSRNVQSGSYRIHYWVGGKGKPLILVHGIGMQGDYFAPLIPAFAENYQVYAIDLPGFGDSDKPIDVDYSIDFQIRQLHNFFDSQKITKAILLGYSMGGWVSLKFALEWPQKVERLILVASPGMQYKLPMSLQHFTNPQNIDELKELINTMSAALPPEFIQRDQLRFIQKQSWVMQRAAKSMFSGRDNLNGKLKKVNMPVLLIWGAEDGLVPPSVGEEMHREMPQSILMTFEHCGHMVLFECKERAMPELQKYMVTAPLKGEVLNFRAPNRVK